MGFLRKMNSNLLFQIGCLSAGASVLIGAFGAHGLKSSKNPNGTPTYTPEMLKVWETANTYQMAHSLGIVLATQRYLKKGYNWPAIFFVCGILGFSGSLYAIVLTGQRKLGIVTPFGGVLFVAGWIALAFS
eukprot:Platyproteum_vivax@DN4262_c0_g1_i2.p1